MEDEDTKRASAAGNTGDTAAPAAARGAYAPLPLEVALIFTLLMKEINRRLAERGRGAA